MRYRMEDVKIKAYKLASCFPVEETKTFQVSFQVEGRFAVTDHLVQLLQVHTEANSWRDNTLFRVFLHWMLYMYYSVSTEFRELLTDAFNIQRM